MIPQKKKKKKIKLKSEIKQEKSLQTRWKDIQGISQGQEKQINDFLFKKELLESKHIEESPDAYSNLYPNLNDINFNVKITERKEFYNTRYDGTLYENISDQAEKLSNQPFELAPHQIFVRNFLSFQTPYNSLLLYHGLGSGKTCSAISVAEEMRDYLKQMNITQRIIIVASPNVQENFKLQLFDERKLLWKNNEGWNIKACTGKKYLNEIMNNNETKGTEEEKQFIIRQIKKKIQGSYLFLGYIEFANYIKKISSVDNTITGKKKEKLLKYKLDKYFNNRLIIIDEVHNIRKEENNVDKRAAFEIEKLVKNVNNLRLLLLSATPLYNSYKEIIWLINLMNMNDNRSTIDIKQVFDKEGNFIEAKDGRESGKELLIRKSLGYISFVRGENPYTFPFRIWPSLFAPQHTVENFDYPRFQMNGKPLSIENQLKKINIYLTKIGSYQQKGYEYIIEKLKLDTKENDRFPSFENMEAFGYTLLQKPLEGLNIIYPNERLDKFWEEVEEGSEVSMSFDSKILVGKNGLDKIMDYKESHNPPKKYDFSYKTDKYGRVFSLDEINKYSSKIFNICNSIKESEGIILIYSQYIDGGLVPIALALEEMGYSRYGKNTSLFKDKPKGGKSLGSYVMITGERTLSPDNIYDVKALTNENNMNGEKVKVVLISQAGSEGLDFKNIRQVHILEPWYNMNRIEQIIGRAVRTGSHERLPFSKRNVEIFLYGTIIDTEEAADLYVYRLAERKSIKIGKVSRVLKENAIDCLLNSEQTNFTEEKMKKVVMQELSDGKKIQYHVGDKPLSSACDYLETCDFKCITKTKFEKKNVKQITSSEDMLFMNTEKIIQRIYALFKEKYFYTKKELKNDIILKKYLLDEIDAALTDIINNKVDYLFDKYGRKGYLININKLYLFQPIELTKQNISIYDREVPISYKRSNIEVNIHDKVDGKEKLNKKEHQAFKIIKEFEKNYNKAIIPQELQRGKEDWYKSCSLAIQEVEKNGIPRKILFSFVIDHMIQFLPYESHLELLNYLFHEGRKIEKKDFSFKIKKYYEENIMSKDNLKGILLQNKGEQKLLIFKNKKWVPAEYQDYKDLSAHIKKIIPDPKRFNNIIGFIANFKKDNNMVFKIKNIEKKRHLGARCDQTPKKDLLPIINEMIGEKKYTHESTKELGKKELCIIQEFILRFFEKNNNNNKTWFLTPIRAVLIDIENYQKMK